MLFTLERAKSRLNVIWKGNFGGLDFIEKGKGDL